MSDNASRYCVPPWALPSRPTLAPCQHGGSCWPRSCHRHSGFVALFVWPEPRRGTSQVHPGQVRDAHGEHHRRELHDQETVSVPLFPNTLTGRRPTVAIVPPPDTPRVWLPPTLLRPYPRRPHATSPATHDVWRWCDRLCAVTNALALSLLADGQLAGAWPLLQGATRLCHPASTNAALCTCLYPYLPHSAMQRDMAPRGPWPLAGEGQGQGQGRPRRHRRAPEGGGPRQRSQGGEAASS